MKCFIFFVLCLVAVCSAEPPRFKTSRFRSRVLSRQEAAPTDATAAEPVTPEGDAPYPAATSPAPAPYPASGWKPTGQAFELPTEKAADPADAYGAPAPDQAYGPPEQAYGPPAVAYGPPTESYGPPDQSAAPEDTDIPVEPEAETVAPLATDGQSGRFRSGYLLLVDPSQLQRVQLAPQRSRFIKPAKLQRGRF